MSLSEMCWLASEIEAQMPRLFQITDIANETVTRADIDGLPALIRQRHPQYALLRGIRDETTSPMMPHLQRHIPLQQYTRGRLAGSDHRQAHAAIQCRQVGQECMYINALLTGMALCDARQKLAIHLGQSRQLQSPEVSFDIGDTAVMGLMFSCT